jgi:hypothetical protein
LKTNLFSLSEVLHSHHVRLLRIQSSANSITIRARLITTTHIQPGMTLSISILLNVTAVDIRLRSVTLCDIRWHWVKFSCIRWHLVTLGEIKWHSVTLCDVLLMSFPSVQTSFCQNILCFVTVGNELPSNVKRSDDYITYHSLFGKGLILNEVFHSVTFLKPKAQFKTNLVFFTT